MAALAKQVVVCVFGLHFAVECGEIASLAREVRYDRRQTVFREGDAVHTVSVVISGRAKITQLSRSGCEVILRVKGSGEVLGGLGMAPGAPQFLSAQTLEPCLLISMGVS